MASITVINLTGGPINSACVTVAGGVISSVRNILSPNEFYVHSAAGPYDLVVRNYNSRDTLFENNWSQVAILIGEIFIELTALGLAAFGAYGVYGSVKLGLMAANTAKILGKAGLIALDLTGAGMAGHAFEGSGQIEGDAKETGIHGMYDNIYKIEGGLEVEIPEVGPACLIYKPITITLISEAEFHALKAGNNIYELSDDGYPILLDENGLRYFIDPNNVKVYHPDSDDEYYFNEKGEQVSYHENKTNPYDEHNLQITGPITNNDGDGDWKDWVYTLKKAGRPVHFTGIEVINDPGYGIVNARLIYNHDDHKKYSFWTSDDMGSNDATRHSWSVREGDLIEEFWVREEKGYGIIDVKLISRYRDHSEWLVGNEYNETNKHDYPLYYLHYDGKILVGLCGKKNPNYGLVDLKLASVTEGAF